MVKTSLYLVLLLVVLACAPAAQHLFAQSITDKQSPAALYDEANNYVTARYEEFNRKHISFDPKLEAATRQEQKDLAVRNASRLAARPSPAGTDFYYLGLLYHLADNSDAALVALRRFVDANPGSDLAQPARAAIVVHALKKNLFTEAEAALAHYAQAQPQSNQERYGMETLVTDAFYKQRDFERMAAHAREMFKAAKLLASTTDIFKRDQMLYKSTLFLSEAYRKLGRKEAAVTAIEELRELAVSLPSGNLSKLATERLLEVDPGADMVRAFAQLASYSPAAAPEIVAQRWLDQTPATLADLNGRVVLLDFWATWCGPCRYTFPKLKAWHDKYQADGLTILGVTKYNGEVDGRTVTHEQELAYLREFKKKNHLPYGFAISDSGVNDLHYGVFSIPMSFLIDRNGTIRFISAGSGEEQAAALGKMIKKLLDEPAKGRKGETGSERDSEKRK
jgi:thiol-disulfide isomerase/thioredoxin